MPDLPPTIAFGKPPRQTEHGALRLEYRATDDYGVEGVKAVMTPAGQSAAREPLVLDLPLPGLHLKDAHGAGYQRSDRHIPGPACR